MKIKKKIFNDVLILESLYHYDKRGFFSEIYNKNVFNNLLLKKLNFKQVNYVFSKKETIRGLHYQSGKFKQGKLVRVLNGKILDFIVNINKKSGYFGRCFSVILSKKNKKIIWVPRDYAHGYMTLEKNTEVEYFCDQFYNKDSERIIKWNDPYLKIKIPKKYTNIKFYISKKDSEGKNFNKLFSKIK
jgi:dTDP-4-dehydrorhamnose 3,5-epimerase